MKKQKKQKEIKYPLSKDVLNAQENPRNNVKKRKISNLITKKKKIIPSTAKHIIRKVEKEFPDLAMTRHITKTRNLIGQKVRTKKDIKIGTKTLAKGSDGIIVELSKKEKTCVIKFPVGKKWVKVHFKLEKGEKFDDFFILKTLKSKNPIRKYIYPPNVKSPFSIAEVEKSLKKAKKYMTPEAKKVVDKLERIEFHGIEIAPEATVAIYTIHGENKYFEYAMRIK